MLSTFDGDLRDPLWWPHERPVPMRVARGSLGFLSHRCQGLRPCVESVPEPEDSSPVQTWILGYFWSLPRGISPRLEGGACTCTFLPSCSSTVALPFAWIKGFVSLSGGFPTRLSHEAFPRGFPTGLYHVPPCCESIGLRHLGHSGNGGMTLEFLSPFLWIAPPLEMRRECREFFPEHEGKGSLL